MTDPTKPYELTFEKRQNYLYARITADETNVPTSVEYWQAIIDKCRELKVKRFLVEQVIPIALSSTDTFMLATEIAAMQPDDIKIAFTDAFEQHYDQNKFGELAAGNRGVLYKFFTTVPEAEDWLLQPTSH